jgi:sigma-B regulation protein RsbU (phosphoserine phosphatase)
MAAELDRLQWLTLLLWLAVLLLFLSSLAALFFSSRSARVHLRVAWFRHRSSARHTLRPLLLTAAVAIVAAGLLQISAGETWAMRLSLVLVGAGVTFVSFDWAWKQTSIWIMHRSGQAREWRLRGEAARRQLQGLLEPAVLRQKACQLMQENLQISHASLFLPQGGVYRRVEASPQQGGCDAEFAMESLLHQELTCGWTFQSLALVDARHGTPLKWSRLVAGDLEGEQARLAQLSAQVAVPLQSQLNLDGFILLGPRNDGRGFSAHHLEFAEGVARQLVDCVHTATLLQPALERVTEQAHEQATRRTARSTRTHLAPPQRTEIPGIDYGADYWQGEKPAGVCYDIISLPKRMAAFLLADVPGPIEDAAVRLVQFQALLRSRAWAYNEDLAELVESTARGLSLSLANHPPISFFCARPILGGRRMQYLNAGHYPPILLRRTSTGAEVTRLHTGGPAIGEFLGTPYQVGEIELQPGDLVAIPSRGLVNALNSESEAWGESRLVDSLLGWESRPVREIVQQALHAADAFTGRDPHQPPRFLIGIRPTSEKQGSNP